MTALRAWFVELWALLRGTGAALSVAQCLDDLARVQRDLERAIAARDRFVSAAEVARAMQREPQHIPTWLLRPDTGGATVTEIRKPKAAK